MEQVRCKSCGAAISSCSRCGASVESPHIEADKEILEKLQSPAIRKEARDYDE